MTKDDIITIALTVGAASIFLAFFDLAGFVLVHFIIKFW